MNGKPTSIMFNHPGGERVLNSSEIMNKVALWNSGKHSRKYVEVDGEYLSSLIATPMKAMLGFWTEWEAPSSFKRVNNTISGFPLYIHTPLKPAKPNSNQLLNTDPCVFGDYFLYSNCQQYTCQGKQATVLQNLEPGDVIIFGSYVSGHFVVDTVFVIQDVISFNRRHVKSKSIHQVPLWYYDLTLNFLMSTHKLYIGATSSQPFSGMFSFFPSVTVSQKPCGFSRPVVLNQYNKGRFRGFKYKGLDAPEILWNQVVQETLSAGLMLGISAEAP
ncbi:hypothetical protein NYE27_01090 [Paenibacillus sp. FSL R10-2779]|uniref:hypothetical protein n=1 Tax=Paenibacillus sp. FSL R10-2779 TaxID=2975340 RepID=UPI0030FBA773